MPLRVLLRGDNHQSVLCLKGRARYALLVEQAPVSLDATKRIVLPLLIEEFEEEIVDSHLVRLTHETVDECLKVCLAGVRSSVVRITRVLGSLQIQPVNQH